MRFTRSLGPDKTGHCQTAPGKTGLGMAGPGKTGAGIPGTGTRRRKASLAAVLASGALVLAACGSATVEDEEPETLSKSSTTASESTAASSSKSKDADKDSKDGKDGKSSKESERRTLARTRRGTVTLSQHRKLEAAVAAVIVERRKSTKSRIPTTSKAITLHSSMMFVHSVSTSTELKARSSLPGTWSVMTRPRFYRR